MELPRAPRKPENEVLACVIQSQPVLADHVGELTGPGHHYNNTTARDNARVQYGDQYHHYYHAGSTVDLTAGAKRLEELLEALAFPQMAFRFAAITNAYLSTCQWLFETPEYTRWRNRSLRREHHGLFWLKGKPGSGKSTVTKCAVEHAEGTFTNERIIYFFFNARGEPIEKTVAGMFRSLLHQMVQDVPQVFGALGSKELARYSSQGWPSELLKSLFREAVCELSKASQLVCYIDALDEGDEDEVRELIDFLEELLEYATDNDLSFSAYLASRHYPNISVHHSEALSLDDHEGHHTDISTYVHSKLRCKPTSLQTELAAEVMQRSSGVFLWVVLVIRDLNKQSDRGNHHRLRSHLQAIPRGLNDLFQRIVCDGGISEYTLPALQIVLFAHRALGPLELYFAILSITQTSSEYSAFWDKDVVDEDIATDFITTSSKGLLELVVEDKNSIGQSVQFIHEAVREYLLNSGMTHLDPTPTDNMVGKGNLRLAKWCQIYLDWVLRHVVIPQLKRFAYCRGESLSSCLPFFEYAWCGALLHSETAARHGAVLQVPFEKFLKSRLWFYWDRGTDKLSRLESRPTILHVLAHERCPNLILQRLGSYTPPHFHNYIDADCPGGYPYVCDESRADRTALQIAIAKQFMDVVDLLLSHGADVNASHQEGYDHPLHIVIPQETRYRESSLTHLYDVKRVEIIKVLLQYGVKLDIRNDSGRTALHEETERGNIEIVQLLLQNGADPNAKAGDHCTSLHMAASTYFGDVEMARTLLRHGADVNARDITGDTALHKSIRFVNVEICKLLLDHGADVNARDEGGGTSLHIGLQYGSVEICRLLLHHGADVNALATAGETPLHQAARDNMPVMVHLLLQNNADVNACNDERSTPLRLAVCKRRVEVVRALLVHGAEVNSLYTREKGIASFMDRLEHTRLREDRVTGVLVRLLTYCRDVPLAARSLAGHALETIIAEEEAKAELEEEEKEEEWKK
jgi:ankyrin repeat protein